MLKALKKRILIIVVIVAALSSCLAVMLTSAKHQIKISGTANIEIAKFEVTVSGEPTDISLTEETSTASFDFSVTSASEVAVECDVVLTLPSTLPSGVTFSVDSKVATADDSGLVYTVENVGAFTVNGGTNTHTLKVIATQFIESVTLPDVRIEVVATQIEPQ